MGLPARRLAHRNLGPARAAAGGQRGRAILGRAHNRAQPGRAIPPLPQTARKLAVLDRGGCRLRPALPQPRAPPDRPALRRLLGHVPLRPSPVVEKMAGLPLPMKFCLGLVIGKFYPPHRGHHHLIHTALAQSERVVVIVCARPTDTIPGECRTAWLQEIHPAAEVRCIDDRYDPDDSQVWAENTVRWLGRAPDAVFTSEGYGERYSALMGSRHVSVDPARIRVPISGTAIRRDPFAHWDFLEPPVRAWFARRVCVLGAESTGTTTLAES